MKLRRTASSTDPTIVSSNATGIYLQEGANPQVTLTTDKVLINHFRLTKQEIPGGHAIVEISTSFSYNTQNPTFAVTRAIESAIARVNAATFDADLLPNQDNTFDIGQISGSNLRWKNGRFSGDVTVGGQIQISGGSPGAGKILTSDASGVGSWQVAAGVPAGAVMFFNLASCPSGWTELTQARGRYVVGLPSAGTLPGSPGTACTDGTNCRGTVLTNMENRAVGQHNHSITDPGHTHSFKERGGSTSPYPQYFNQGASEQLEPTTSATTGITVNNAGTVTGTNAPYIQLLTCQKS